MEHDGCFKKEDRERFVRMETLLEGVSEVLFSETGTARCATHTEKIKTLEKRADNSSRWVKGIVIAMAGSAFVFTLNLIWELATVVPAP